MELMRHLSTSQQTKVHLARGFIMNPEILVLQQPFMHLGDGEDDMLVASLRERIDCRGIAMPPESMGRRRPRTVFMTCDSAEEEEAADVFWFIENDGSVHMRLPQKIAA